MITKTLVFHFYIYNSPDYFNNIAYKFHMLCLKRYAHAFDKACFNLACDNIEDKETINRIKHELIDCGFNNIEIIVTQNDQFCEVNTFNYFIKNKLGTTSDLIFFAHTKGICNVIDGVNFPENILYWIWTLYYFNLEDEYIKNMKMRLVHAYGGHEDTFYGTCRIFVPDYSCSFYSGTFYWINAMKLYEDDKQGIIRLPNQYNRAWCEKLPTVYKDPDNAYKGVASLYNRYIDKGNFYEWNDWAAIAEHFACGKGNEDYLKGFNEIREQI